jgi:diaminopimelate decarboxylase
MVYALAAGRRRGAAPETAFLEGVVLASEGYFHYRQGELHCEETAVADLAERWGTPLYVYSRSCLVERYRAIRDAFAARRALVCFSVKSCPNLSILRLLAAEGAGFDVVSGGELQRVLAAGGNPERVVFAGVGKTPEEIDSALRQGILMFNVESRAELEAISAVAARLDRRASVAIRVNPDVDAHAHEKTTTGKKDTKFGIGIDAVADLTREAVGWPGLAVRGVHVHLGSLIEQMREAGAPVDSLNMGGGFCISYTGQEVVGPREYAAAVDSRLEKSGCPVIIIEPGRYIAGSSAALLTRVVYRKEAVTGKRFLVCDAAMNDLIRPTLYGAFHRIWPVRSAEGMPEVITPAGDDPGGLTFETVDVVGPVCETGDFLARARALPRVEAGELLAVFDAGAYGFAMSSNYNARPRAAEALVDGAEGCLIRRRETFEDMIGPEREFLR